MVPGQINQGQRSLELRVPRATDSARELFETVPRW